MWWFVLSRLRSVAARERLASELMVLLSPVLRKHASIGKGYEEILNSMLARSGSKDCLIELLCKNVVRFAFRCVGCMISINSPRTVTRVLTAALSV